MLKRILYFTSIVLIIFIVGTMWLFRWGLINSISDIDNRYFLSLLLVNKKYEPLLEESMRASFRAIRWTHDCIPTPRLERMNEIPKDKLIPFNFDNNCGTVYYTNEEGIEAKFESEKSVAFKITSTAKANDIYNLWYTKYENGIALMQFDSERLGDWTILKGPFYGEVDASKICDSETDKFIHGLECFSHLFGKWYVHNTYSEPEKLGEVEGT